MANYPLVGCALLDQRAELLGLALHRVELILDELALQLERFLRVLHMDELLREVERGVDVLLGETEHIGADMLDPGLGVGRHAVDRSGRLLRHRHEAFEGLARLIDAALGEIAQLVGDFIGSVCHRVSPSPRPRRDFKPASI
jgi:hypothetical protein